MIRDLLSRLVSIPSLSREEDAAASFLEGYLRELGLCPSRHGNNLWCVKGSGPAVLLDAHIDTVKPSAGWETDPFTPVWEGEKLTGLGANDDGGSVAALIQVFLRYEPRHHSLVLSLSAQEEVSGAGGLESVLPLIEKAVGPISCGIMGEPTGLRMAVAEKGLMVLDCTARGEAAHAASGKGVNAIAQALPDIQWFLSQGMQVTQISAGTQHNVIPDRCSFVVDVRTEGSNQAVLEKVLSHVSCEVQARSTRLNGSSIAPSHPLVAAAGDIGLQTYSSPTLSNQAVCAFPTVKLGPGESARSHTAGEYILLSEVERAVDVYLALLEAYENLG